MRFAKAMGPRAIAKDRRGASSARAGGLLRAHIRLLSGSVAAVAISLAAIIGAPAVPQAWAQASGEGLLDGLNRDIDRTQPLLLQADELITDNANNTIIAQGNVEIYFNGYTLLADRVVYDQTSKQLTAEGNVRIKEPNGAIINAERITLTDDFRDGFVESLRVVTRDDARFAAASAVRRDGNVTVFDRGVFTPCKVCESNPEKPPLWRIKARRIIRDLNEGNVYYEDAALEFFGVPVIQLPFFSHPDPTVKRRSGFLRPGIGYAEQLGAHIETPYFWAIAPNMDVTFNPKFMSKEGVLLNGEWRHRLANGSYRIELSGIYDEDSEAGPVIKDEFRGSFVTEGRFQLGTWWHWGWDATIESDDTFRRFYELDKVTVTERISKLYLEGLNDRNYFAANVYRFDDLTLPGPTTAESNVHPVVDYNYIFANPVLGGELSFDANVLSLSREDNGPEQSKVVAEAQWRRQLIDVLGQVFTPFFRGRADAYNSENAVLPAGTDESQTRGQATAGLQYSYPFVTHTERASHVVEPVAQIISRTGNIERGEVSNEDAQSLVFDNTLLFEADKFSGYDRVETGTRANVGMRYTMQLNSGGYVRAVFGQSYQISGDNPFDAGSGLATGKSDYVAGLNFALSDRLAVVAQTRFDQDTFTVQRQDIAATVNYGLVRVTGNYSFERATPAALILRTEEEIYFNGSLQIAENWALLGGARYDIENDFALENTIGIQYSDECLVLAVSYAETRVEDRDVDPDQTLMVRFELKYLGGGAIATGQVNDLLADSE